MERKVEVKNVKHVFTPSERLTIGTDLSRTLGGKRGIEAELDQVKASYKAKLAEADAKIDKLSTDLQNGFEMRDKACVVHFIPKERIKYYYLESDCGDAGPVADTEPVAVEPMTYEEFQTELLMADAAFDKREEITIFPPTDNDYGNLVVGTMNGRWVCAVRMRVGKLNLTERMDSEQKACKERIGAITEAVGRAKKWLKENTKEAAKGFDDFFTTLIEAHKERAE